MDLITKGKITAKAQSKVIELVLVVKLIGRLLLFAVNTLNYCNYRIRRHFGYAEFRGGRVFFAFFPQFEG